MPSPEPLTRRRTVDLVRVAAALLSGDRLTTRFLAPPVNSLAVQACCVRNTGRWVPAPARA
ncbi:hypothetical protein ACRJ4W_14595 [Streptomyces sp. GLT-R25]